jgi:hypothetical protein
VPHRFKDCPQKIRENLAARGPVDLGYRGAPPFIGRPSSCKSDWFEMTARIPRKK